MANLVYLKNAISSLTDYYYVFKLACFEEGTDSSGSDVPGTSTHDDVSTVYRCQALCQDSEECKYFVYDTSSKKCGLKTEAAKGLRWASENKIFGPKWCGKGWYFHIVITL